ncbi:separase [Aristolochia californica]|uniref:separase n=1 Tax=Aristolochia californica TaxID=171875 RepID=UPI0035D7910F
MHGGVSLFSYICALDFLCKPFADSVNTVWKHSISESEDIPFLSDISAIQDLFLHLCHAFVVGLSNACDRERERLHEKRSILFHVVMAAFRVSLRTSRKSQECVNLIDSVLSQDWIEAQEIKFLISSVYNVGVSFFNNKQLEKASIAFALSHRASWIHVSLLCHKFTHQVEKMNRDKVSDEMIKDSVSDACAKTAVYLDVLHQSGNSSTDIVIVNCLRDWSAARDLLNLGGPVVLVKQWAKILCKDALSTEAADKALSLCSLLPSCSTQTMAIILEQELLAYSELESRNPSFCQKMQLKIISILLKDIYGSKNCPLEMSKVLLSKGRLIRSSAVDGLKNCIQCLSEAISVLKDILDEPSKRTPSVSHQLALTYCLHALCIQEEDQNLKVILHDISSALMLWSSIDIQNHSMSDSHVDFLPEKTIPLLCHVADLLSLKGCLEFQFDIYKLIITLSKRQDISMERCLALLWGARRVNHPFCVFPISESFLLNLSNQFGSHVESLDFWISCIEDYHLQSMLGFCQKLLIPDSISFQVDGELCKTLSRVNISIERIKEAASSLISSVPVSNESAFLAGYLYYDLSERLISTGQLFEALAFAREAHRLRTKLLNRKFIYSVGAQFQKGVETGDAIHNNESDNIFLQATGSHTTEIWPNFTKLQNLEECILSPWNVLQCYLESCLQVGLIHENIGNGADAEAFLLVGKKISCVQSLPLYRVAFGCFLGRIYCQKGLWSLAEDELEKAKQILYDSNSSICANCKLKLEVTLDLQIGDLAKGWSHLTTQVKPLRNKYSGLDVYRTALDKLNLPDLKNVAVKKVNNSNNRSACLRRKQILKPENSVKTTSARVRSCHPIVQVDEDLVRCDDVERRSLQDFISLKWEFHRRCLSLKLLSRMGKCMRAHSEVHELHKIFLQSISLVFKKYKSSHTNDNSDLLRLMGEKSIHMFVVEYATLLYDVSSFSMQNLFSEQTGKIKCCALCDIEVSRVVSWLLQAFVLCRELPLLLEKVARLLAALFFLLTVTENSSLPMHCGKSLSSVHWAAYFHQASVGTYISQHYLSSTSVKLKGAHFTGSEDHVSRTCNSCRLVPEKLEDLENFVETFFNGLPNVPIVCISMLGRNYANLVGQMLHVPSTFPAWLLFSRFYSDRKPFIMFIPVDSFVEENQSGDDDPTTPVSEGNKFNQKWICPWGYTTVDDIAPQFRSILEENYLSTSNPPQVDTQKTRIKWWIQRTRLNDRLDTFLRNVEDLWLGPWKCLLLGEPSNTGNLDKVVAKLRVDLRRKCNFEIHEHLLRTVVGGASSVAESEQCVSQLVLYKGYLGRGGASERCELFSSFCGVGGLCGSPHQLIVEAIEKVAEDVVDRGPVVLVMDADIQMLPWESLPVLRKQEVYRMLSLQSIRVALHREKVRGFSDMFPQVDPGDAYFVLNPSGDLNSTQLEFEEWFKNLKWEGRAGIVPTTEELARALQSHDLFLYFGHGSGVQYISSREIQKLENCAATLLMGCSSGSLSIGGCYGPQGAPVSYLLAGSPAIICNLWDVTDKDIDRFGKVVVDSWLKEASKAISGCSQCNALTKELGQLTLGAKVSGKAPRTRSKAIAERGKSQDSCDYCKCREHSKRVTLASFMGEARDACRLPVLIGASPVCYGVPTIIQKKASQ